MTSTPGSHPAGHAPARIILHLQDRWSARGGADLHLLGILARGGSGTRSILVTGRDEDPYPLPGGVEHHRCPGLGGRAREGAGAARRVMDLLRRLRPDLVHVHNVLQPEVLRGVAAWGPALVTVQDHRSFCPGRGRVRADGLPCPDPPGVRCAGCFEDRTYGEWIQAETRRRGEALLGFRRVVVLSRYMAGELAAAGVPPERVRVVPPFVLAPEEAPGAEVPGPPVRILAAGRLTWAKGFHALLEAWVQAGRPLPLVVAGDGPARRELQARWPEANFPGWISHGDLPALRAGARVFVLPSLWQEPFGIAGLEALAAGVPVAAFDVGGVPEWLPPEAGWLLPPGDVAGLARALQEAALDPGGAAGRGRRGAAHAARCFAPGPLMARLEGVYDEVLGGA